MLNIGLAWVAYRNRWPILSILTLVFTTLYQWGWVARYLDAAQVPLAIAIFTVFPVVGYGVLMVARSRARDDADDRRWPVRVDDAGGVGAAGGVRVVSRRQLGVSRSLRAVVRVDLPDRCGAARDCDCASLRGVACVQRGDDGPRPRHLDIDRVFAGRGIPGDRFRGAVHRVLSCGPGDCGQVWRAASKVLASTRSWRRRCCWPPSRSW